jgi:hypothetical protein
MRHIARMLKDMFSVPPSADPRNDVPPMGIGRARDRRSIGLAPLEAGGMDVCWYCSEADLQRQMRRRRDFLRHSDRLTVVLLLGDFLRGSLRELVRQQRPGHRLVIVPQAGHWPGVDSFGDLALAAGTLGWNSIEICRGTRAAPEDLAVAVGQDEPLLLVLPAAAPARILM